MTTSDIQTVTGHAPPRLPMSYEEYYAWADEDIHAEWVDGEVIVHMPPFDIHQTLLNFLNRLLAEYAEFEAAFRRAGCEGMMAVYRDPSGATRVRGNVALSPDGLVARYDKASASPDLEWVEAGVLAFRRSVLERIPAGRVVSLEREVYPALIRERALAGYRSAHRFFDIGTRERIADMEAWLRK